jgi:hypothetical protein
MLTDHSLPDQAINVLDRLNLRLDDTHLLHDTPALPSFSTGSVFYNTVILDHCFTID